MWKEQERGQECISKGGKIVKNIVNMFRVLLEMWGFRDGDSFNLRLESHKLIFIFAETD